MTESSANKLLVKISNLISSVLSTDFQISTSNTFEQINFAVKNYYDLNFKFELESATFENIKCIVHKNCLWKKDRIKNDLRMMRSDMKIEEFLDSLYWGCNYNDQNCDCYFLASMIVNMKEILKENQLLKKQNDFLKESWEKMKEIQKDLEVEIAKLTRTQEKVKDFVQKYQNITTLLEKKPENEGQKMFAPVSKEKKLVFEEAKGFFQNLKIASLEKNPENEGQKKMFPTASETDSNKEITFFFASKLGQVEYKFCSKLVEIANKMEEELQDLLNSTDFYFN